MRVSVDRLKPGMRLAENIYVNASSKVPLITTQKRAADGSVVYTYLTETEIRQLKEKGIQTVKIELINDVKETIDDSIQDDVIKSLKEAIESKDLNIKGVIDVAGKIAYKIVGCDNLKYSFSSYQIEKDDFFKEAMDECSFAVAIAKKYNKTVKSMDNAINLENVAVACLLSKIGKFCEYDETILKRIKPVTGLNTEYFPGYDPKVFDKYDEKYVPIYSYYMLKNNNQLGISSESVKLAVLLSDEDEIGKGPLQSSKKTVGNVDKKSLMMGKMLKISKMYESFINKCVREKLSPSNVMEILGVFAANKLVDLELFDVLKKAIPLYSPGIRVILSDGKSGMVVKTNENFFDKPIITLDSTGEIINLNETTTLTIKGISNFDLDYAIYLVQNRDRVELEKQQKQNEIDEMHRKLR